MTDFTYILLLGLAAASLFKLAAVDRITQAPRYWAWNNLNNRGWFRMHILYVTHCALCLPMWVAAAGWLGREADWVRAVVYILAARMVGWVVLCYLNQTGIRDLPVGHEFPPSQHPAPPVPKRTYINPNPGT